MTENGLLAILAMGLATYATRAGGFWLARRIEAGPFMLAWLQHLPGTVFAALVAPMVAGAGPAGWIAAAAGFLAMRLSGQFLLALAAGLLAYIATGALLGR